MARKLSKKEVILEITGGKEIELFHTPQDVQVLRNRLVKVTEDDFNEFAENDRNSYARAQNTYID